jgi:regulator of protease activity HflC (stomatin/prohibitin superfamily)
LSCPQIAQQTALKAAFLVDKAMQEKQSIIVRAQGEAKAAELVGNAMRQNKGFLSLRRLEAARDIAALLTQSENKVMLDARTLLLNGIVLDPWKLRITHLTFQCQKMPNPC